MGVEMPAGCEEFERRADHSVSKIPQRRPRRFHTRSARNRIQSGVELSEFPTWILSVRLHIQSNNQPLRNDDIHQT